jgi:uncharacterized protein (TIGR02246 family)
MSDTPNPQLRQELDAFSKKYDEAFNNNDAASVAALFTEDAVLVNDTGPIYGRKAIKEHLENMFASFISAIISTRPMNILLTLWERLAMRRGATGHGL